MEKQSKKLFKQFYKRTYIHTLHFLQSRIAFLALHHYVFIIVIRSKTNEHDDHADITRCGFDHFSTFLPNSLLISKLIPQNANPDVTKSIKNNHLFPLNNITNIASVIFPPLISQDQTCNRFSKTIITTIANSRNRRLS